MILFIGLFIGILWGIIFEKTGIFRPKTILKQLTFEDFTMLKMMGSAIVTSFGVLWVAHYFVDIGDLVKPLDLFPNIFGGIFMGIGIALTGACPGTAWAQLGAGYKNARFIIFGGIVAATLYGFFLNEIELFFKTNPQKEISTLWVINEGTNS